MEGYSDPPELRGILPLTFKYIYDAIGSEVADNTKQFMVRASYLEIYNENVKDLLSKNSQERLEIKENSDS